MMKKYKLMAFSLFIVVMLSIITFHSSINVVERVTPPSAMWARHISVGVTDFRKAPSSFAEGDKLGIIFADEKGFKKVLVDKKGSIVESKTIQIKDYRPTKLVKYQSSGNQLFWTENYDLYCADITNASPSKTLLLSEILDYFPISYGNKTLIAVAAKDTLSLYSFSDGAISKLSEDVKVKDIYYIAAARDKNGDMYVVAVSKNSPTEYGLRLFSYGKGEGKAVERITPAAIENISTTREGSNSMNNLQVAFDDKDIYVFYEIGKSSSQGMVARTYMGRVSRDSEGKPAIDFSRLNLNNNEEAKETYISSLDCLDGVSDKVDAIIITPVRTSIKREGSEIMFISIDDGKVVEKSVASNTGEWNRFAELEKVDGEYMAAFLQTLGGIHYKINVAGTGIEFKNNLNKTTFTDIKYSVMDTVGGYVFSFFPIFINLLITAPILLWPIAVDFFEWNVFFRNPLLTLNVGVAAETAAMGYSISRIYLNKESVAYMPALLRHPASPFAALLLTACISYIFIRLFRRSKTDLHSFPELALFMLVHNIIVYFLYTAYIARF